ncbi:MAG: S46 family peptidase, partial [Paludibacter sp.]|nr:S46 family peptidase [Paludibacter sp.]
MNKAIKKLGVIDRKQEEEKAFAAWANETPERKAKYGNVLPEMKENYAMIFPTLHAISYLREALINGVEMPQIASEIEDMMVSEFTTDSIIKAADESYKDYYPEVDKAALSVMLRTYRKFVDSQYLPAIYQTIDKKFKGNYEAYANYIYEKSDFTDKAKLIKKLQSGKINLKKDPALVFLREVEKTLSNLNNNNYNKGKDIIANAERLFESGLKEINTAKGIKSYPDANFTMRLTYGTIDGYEPADATTFNYYTTTKGILEKEIPGDMEFDVPSTLKTAIINKDFGRFAHPETGEMIVNFLSSNDITGGNSGSPIFNAQGELTGLAFDGNWEAMSGDIVFEAKLQRTINLDVRYLLFVMEKTGDAHRLINELELH